MEKTMLNTLGFQLTVPSPYVFLQRFLKAIKIDKEVTMLSEYLVELSLLDYNMLNFAYSKIAAAATYTASKCILKTECWCYASEQETHYSAENLEQCTAALYELLQQAPTASLQATFRKFSGP